MPNLLRSLRPRRPPSSRPVAPVIDAATSPTLPPGDSESFDDLEPLDRTLIARRSRELGPVFHGRMHGELCVCIVGIALGRRFLSEHGQSLHPLTLDLAPLVPKGFLRQMRGDDHRDYRRQLVRAARALDGLIDDAALEAVCTRGMERLAERPADSEPSPVLDVATDVATAVLIVLFFGAEPGSDRFAQLLEGYRRLGRYGLVWNLGDAQHQAFAELRRLLRHDLGGPDGDARVIAPAGDARMHDACVLAQLAHDGEVDDTMLGNLIYMVEMGRMDLQVFVRWLLRYAAAHPDAIARIADETAMPPDPTLPVSAAEAFVLEVLRTDQSERLMRRTTRDIVFEGYLIPTGSYVRICMWESHHDGTVFADPERFDPERFVVTSPTREQYSPFGLDHHQCPFAAMSIRLGMAVLRAIARFDASIADDGPPVRGAYHWEPSRRLRLDVRRR